MSTEVLQDLRDFLSQAAKDESVRVVVLTGAGDTAFSAGADLAGMETGAGVMAAHEARGLLSATFRDLWQLGKPSIARIRGYALAGGFGLALACDFVIAAEDAQFGTPEIDVGLWPYMITVPLLRSMPMRIALELMMTGRRVSSEEALRIGFVNRVVPIEELDEAVETLTAILSEKSPLTMELGRRSFYRASQLNAEDALEYLQAMLTVTTLTEDTAEGLAAFREKRAPRWSGR